MQRNNASANQKNIHAILQQRRLRHVSGICIRNLSLFRLQNDKPEGQKLFVKIACAENVETNTDVIFESEHIAFCPNPSWLGFDLTKLKRTVCNSLHVELWLEDWEGRQSKVFNWNWKLSRLRYIAERLYQGEINFAPNALVLQIHGSFHSFSDCFTTDTPHGNCPHFNLDEEKVSCNVFSLRRMVTSQKSITQSKQRSMEHKSACNELMQHKELFFKRKKEIEDLRGRIKLLKLLLHREASHQECEHELLSEIQSSLKTKEGALAENQATMVRQRDHFDEISGQIDTNRQRTTLLNSQLALRRMEIFSELAYIFPIHPYTPPSGTKNSHSSKNQKQSSKMSPGSTICGIHLPDAESLSTKEDSKNAVALGYVSQMLYMVSYFLLIPLRYPLMLQGSQTSIVDNMTEKIQDKERVFPLFVRTNKERFLFEYGMYLLNKNVGQVRYAMGIPTSDLRPTLHNLKTLLEHTIGARPGKTLAVRPSSNTSSRSPARKPEKKEKKEPPVVAPTTNLQINGVSNAPIDLEEKVHDRSLELHNLRGELFGSTKSSKPTLVSPRHSATLSSSVKVSRSISPANMSGKRLTGDTKIFEPESANAGAAFLTGLEDLDHSTKAKSNPQQPLDIATARNELFKTKSGRRMVTKRHTYTMRSGQSDRQFPAEEQPSRTQNEESTSRSNNDCLTPLSSVENGESLNDHFPNKEISSPKIPSAESMSMSEDLDLC